MLRSVVCVLLGLTAIVLGTGCGEGKVRLGGKVTFADGAPLTVGAVCFTTDTYMADGLLDAQGNYALSSTGDRDGLPPGKYRVFVKGADEMKGEVAIPLIAQQFSDRTKTTLECEVTSSNKRFDFVVERPAGK